MQGLMKIQSAVIYPTSRLAIYSQRHDVIRILSPNHKVDIKMTSPKAGFYRNG